MSVPSVSSPPSPRRSGGVTHAATVFTTVAYNRGFDGLGRADAPCAGRVLTAPPPSRGHHPPTQILKPSR
eukprot:12936010-Prorocentrum_lima.AAC.1